MAKIGGDYEFAGAAESEGVLVPQHPERVTVEIFGDKYIVRGEGAPEYIQGLAHEVDKKMRLVAHRLPHLSIHQIAVLTALNLADDLAKLREEHETLLQLLGEKEI